MNALSVLSAGAVCFGLAMAIAPCLQIQRIIKRKHSGDVSVIYLMVILAGAVVWTAYGVAAHDIVVVIPNAVGALSNTAAVSVAWKFRHGVSNSEVKIAISQN